MSKSLIFSFNSAVAKYSRLSKKVRKSISKGEFWRLNRRKRHYLLNKIERLRRRIVELRFQLKFAGTGLAAGLLMMSAGEAYGQKGQPLDPPANASRIGPFVQNDDKSPFPKPLISVRRDYPAVNFVDLDNDGDLDAALTHGSEFNIGMDFYRNIGTTQKPRYEKWGLGNVQWNPGNNNINPARAAFADVDDDGDLDLVIGMRSYDSEPPESDNDRVIYWRNDGNAQEPYFIRPVYYEDPFDDFYLTREAWPAFTDIDKDGDLDFVLAGAYYDDIAHSLSFIQVFRNDKEGHEPGVPSYTPLVGPEENPLYYNFSALASLSIAFADLDGDGDEDFFAAQENGGTITYKRNDGGVFVEQTGPYTHQPGGQSTGNPLEIDNIEPYSNSYYRSLAFGDLDGDGDEDLLIGNTNVATIYSPFIYVENTGNGVMTTDRSFKNPITGFSVGENADASLIDYDGDGDLDVLATGSLTVPDGEGTPYPTVGHYLFKNDNGQFVQQSLQNDPFAAFGILGEGKLLAKDVDGDNDLDLIVMGVGDNSDMQWSVISYYRNDNGTYQLLDAEDAGNPFLFLNADQEYYEIDLGDLNGDALPDLVVFENGRPPIFYKNTGTVGNPIFSALPEEEPWSTGLHNYTYEYTPKFIDVDNDGDNDLLVGKYHYLWYYENVGDKTTPSWSEYEEQYENQNFENPFGSIYFDGSAVPSMGDIDGDGDKDLLVGSWEEGWFEFYENQNPTPTIDLAGTPTDLEFVLNTALPLAPQIVLSDSDGDSINSITLKIAPYTQGIEKLQTSTNHDGINIVWDDAKGTLTLSGAGSIDSYQDALRDVEYLSYDEAPSDRKSSQANGKISVKSISLVVLDEDLTVGSTNTLTFNLLGDDGTTNTPPTISGVANPFYISGDLVINDAIVVADPDTIITNAKVVFATGFHSSEDVLVYQDQNGITGNYNAAAGLLSLSGLANPAQYQAALRSVKYRNTSSAPSTEDRAITFSVSDGGADVSVTTTLTFNKPPVIAVSVKHTPSKGNIALSLDAIVSDPDNNADLSTFTASAQSGAVTTISNLILTVDYNSVPNFEGDDVITVEVCDTGGRCTTYTFIVQVRADAVIYTGLSPNGDGINDWFTIDFLPEGTQVAIYNRWGDAIFETSSYDMNEPSARFEGKSKNGTEVIAGSYYYKVKYPDGRVKTGYILLNR